MSLEPREFLRHILAEATYLLQASKDVTYEEFIGNGTLVRAFSRSIEIKVPDLKQNLETILADEDGGT